MTATGDGTDTAHEEPTGTDTDATGPQPSRAAPPAGPTFTHQPPKCGFIGPFGGRQIAMGTLLVAAVVIALVAVTAPIGNTGVVAKPNPQPTPFLIGPAAAGLTVGSLAPDFTTTRPDGTTFRLTDLDGRPVSLAELRGKAVWVNFWASWCPPCQAETPILRQTAATYRDRGLVVLGISVQESSAADVRSYADRYSLGYPVAADLSGDIYRLYRVFGLPTSFFVDGSGRIASIVVGPLDDAGAAAHVEAILPPGS